PVMQLEPLRYWVERVGLLISSVLSLRKTLAIAILRASSPCLGAVSPKRRDPGMRGAARASTSEYRELLSKSEPGCSYELRGGKRYNVIASTRYTASTSTPWNHAARPPFDTSAAVRVAISIITTAPGQNCKSIRVGPRTYLASPGTGEPNEESWAALPSGMPTLRSGRFLRAPEKADAISAAAPTRATTMNPTKAGVMPKATTASCTDSTKISLTKA